MIKILYFASLKEKLAKEQEEIPAKVTNVEQLIELLAQRGENWASIFTNEGRLRVAVNQNMARKHTPIQAGDEVAFFPPVTGG